MGILLQAPSEPGSSWLMIGDRLKEQTNPSQFNEYHLIILWLVKYPMDIAILPLEQNE